MTKETETYINYPKLVDDSMRGLAKNLLMRVSKEGMIGEHYFLVTFLTNSFGVKLSDRLKKRYPSEMTIILQHQYEDLFVSETELSVRLSFDSIKETVVIPFSSLTSFVDPSTKFALQFNPEFSQSIRHNNVVSRKKMSDTSSINANDSNVINLDQFRKKKDK